LLHVSLNEKWHELSKKFAKILKIFEQESTHDTVESENPQSDAEQYSQDGKKICGPCGDTYPADGDFCPSCGWENLPC